MKSGSFFLFILFCLAINIRAQEQWVQQSSGTTSDLYSVYFVDSTTGWAVGQNGVIIKTTNGGTNWTAQTSGTTDTLRCVQFINGNVGYAAGGSKTGSFTAWQDILKTTNGGTTWSVLHLQSIAPLASVFFVNGDTGYAGSTYTSILGGVIVKTTNGGNSWFTVDSGSVEALSMYFTTAASGYVVGGLILKTTNGGASWTTQTTGTTLRSIYFTDANTGYAVGNDANTGGIILKTTNGGGAWVSQTSGTTLVLYSVHFTGVDTGYAVGGSVSNGVSLKTVNGGATWTTQFNTPPRLNSTYFVNGNAGWAVGRLGGIIKHTTSTPILMRAQPHKRFGQIGNVFAYNLTHPSHVQILLFDLNGKQTLRIVDEEKDAGYHKLPLKAIPFMQGILDFRTDEIHEAIKLNQR